MDREAREHYSVVIQAKDMAGQVGGLSGSTTVNITLTDVNDNPPRFPQSMYPFLLVYFCTLFIYAKQNEIVDYIVSCCCYLKLDFVMSALGSPFYILG